MSLTEDKVKVQRLRVTCVALVAVADNLPVTSVLVTRSSEVTSTVGAVWAGTRATLTARCGAQNWVTVVTTGTPAEINSGEEHVDGLKLLNKDMLLCIFTVHVRLQQRRF